MLPARDYTIGRHFETFDWLAERLAGHVDRCIFSFAEMYRKFERNMPELQVMSLDQIYELGQGDELTQGAQRSLLAAPQVRLDL